MKAKGLCMHLMWLMQSAEVMVKGGRPTVFQYLPIRSVYDA